MAERREEFQDTQQQILLIGRLAEDIDIATFLAAIDRAETVGIFFSAPMAYQVGTRRLRPIATLARAVAQVQDAYRELKEVVRSTEDLAEQARQFLPGGGR